MVAVENAVNKRDQDRLPSEAKQLLQSLASSWDDVADSNALQVIPLKGAMSNEVFQVKWSTKGDSRKVLLRVYGNKGVEVYHTETPHILDYSKYPGLEERRRFLCTFFTVDPGVEHHDHSERDHGVENLLQDIEKFTLASHLVWGLWGIISAHVNEIDFDYIEYARQRFDQYWLMKPTLLGSKGPSLLPSPSPPFDSIADDKCPT